MHRNFPGTTEAVKVTMDEKLIDACGRHGDDGKHVAASMVSLTCSVKEAIPLRLVSTAARHGIRAGRD
jgi:hypothetical protein